MVNNMTLSARHAYMAHRLRLVDDVAVFDMAQQLGIGISALLRDLGAAGVDIAADAALLAVERDSLAKSFQPRAAAISFLARFSSRSEELTQMWVEKRADHA